MPIRSRHADGTEPRDEQTPVPRTRQSRYDVLTKTMVPATAATRKNSDFGDGVDDFHIKWFAGILQGLDPQLAEGFKGAIEEAADELGIHAEPGETAQQLMFRVVTCSKPSSKVNHQHLRASDSGKIDAELINLVLPACVSISMDDGEVVIDPEMLVGFLGPTILSGFRAFGWLELITLPVILSVIVVLVLEWDSTCRMIEDRERNVDPIALRTFFIAKTVTALATWIANAVMSRTAGELYDQCIGPQQETVRLIQEKEDEIRVQTGGTKSKLLSMLDKRTLIDASLQAGLEMIVKRDELLTSWIYRAYQLCFLPDMMMDIMMLYLLSRFVAVEQEHCKYHDGNKNSLNMLMALALWAAITLAFRTAIVSTWLARALFFADKAGLYHWGYKWCEEKDDKLFFGSEVARKTYASLYSRHRKERIQAKLAPLGARTHEALLKLNIFDLSSQRRRYRRKIVEVEDKLDQYTSRYNEIYEETGKSFIKRDSGHYEHRISYQWPETESPPPPRPSSLEDPEPNTERSRFGYNLVKTKQGRQAPPPLSKRHALPPLSKRRPRTESVSRTLSGDSNASDMSPITKRVEASMQRALLKKQLSSGRMGMEEGPPSLHRAPDTIVELNDAAGVAPPPRLSTHEEFYDTYSGDDLEGGPALEETDDDDLGAAVADRRRRKLSTAV